MVGQAEQVVTGDAVVLDVQIAQLPVRALSALIDVSVIFVGYLAGVMLWAITLSEFDPALSGSVLIIFTVLTIIGYPVIFESATRGKTLGKMALGLRVVSDDGGPERFRQALFRGLASFIEIWMFFGGPAVICSLLSPKGKRLGDVFAGTVVISERGPRLPPPPVMPPSLAWWASSLQLSGLGPEQAELARQFLSRASQLNPQTREQMAYRIAGRGGRAHLATATAGCSSAVRARRGAGGETPARAGAAATPACATAAAAAAFVGRRAGAVGSAARTADAAACADVPRPPRRTVAASRPRASGTARRSASARERRSL